MSGLQLFQTYIKMRVEIALEKNELLTIKLPADQVQWYEKGREILVDGKMFDIKSYTVVDNVFIAQGIFDEKETEVVRMMGHFGEKEQQLLLIKLLLLIQSFVSITALLFGTDLLVFIKQLFQQYIITYLSPCMGLFSPPPKIVL
jgi:hypothetical protein